jgi:hypothetical protein
MICPRSTRYGGAELVGLCLCALAAGQASAAPEGAPEPIFKQVIRQPNGQNGYEELVLAGDVLRTSRVFQKAEAGPTTLSFKREVLADRPVVRALALLRQGLTKPIFSPRQEVAASTLFPEFASLRAMARLLVLQQYVLLADGRVPEAIASLRSGLRLSRAIQTDTLISGMVGIAVTSICTHSMGGHLDQLSARDCEQLYHVCLDWLNQPNPFPRILDGERRFIKQNLTEFRQTGRLWFEDDSPVSGEFQTLGMELKRMRSSSLEAFSSLLQETEKRVDAYFDRELEELKKPAWQRAPVEMKAESPADRYAASMLPMQQVCDKYVSEEAHVRLLACHAAIRRYRWEQNRLPDALAALELGELALDPFTGRPLSYQVRGTSYRLSSVGPVTDADDPRVVDGRRPVSIVPGE